MNFSFNNFLKPKHVDSFASLSRVAQVFLSTTQYSNLVQKVVDSVLQEVGTLGHDFHVAVLALKDKDNPLHLKRISMSRTGPANEIRNASKTAFEDIVTPLSAKENFCIRALNERKYFLTHSFTDILYPPFSIEKCDRLQEAGGIQTSIVFPIIVQNEPMGIVIFSTQQRVDQLTKEEEVFIESLAGIIGIAVENANLFEQLERKRSALKIANKRLKDLDKLKDEFVSVASHELRTPMTSIKSYLWMAIEGKGGKVPAKVKFYLERAYTSTDRLIKLVNDMLNISRIESGRIALNFTKVDMVKLTQEVIDEVLPRCKELSLAINFEDTKDIPAVVADVDKIKEVLINFIGNSMKFTPKKGTITVHLRKDKEMVVTEVQDTGVGMDKDTKASLFQKFGLMPGSYRTNQNAALGTGLGLYISKSIIELHGGKIWGESAGKDKGSTFSFTVPVYSAEKLEQMKAAHPNKTKLGIIHTKLA